MSLKADKFLEGEEMGEQSDPKDQPPCWAPSHHALEHAQRMFREDLPAIDLVGLTRWLTTQLQRGRSDDREHCKVYADALYDMSRLIDEVRFETSLAATYIVELNDKFSTKEGDYSGFPGTFGVPGTAIALLSPQLENKPLLTQLFTDPIVPLPENRVLAGWFAAQLLDSALIRSVAAVDCIAVLLWSAAGCPFSTDGQFSFTLPDFRQSDLKLIESEYSSRPAWLSLYRLADHECVQIAGQYRHGFVHRRRAPTELHGGAEAVVRFGGGDAESTLSKGAQLAMVGKFYRDVLCVATGLAGELLLPGSSDDAN